jgi:hypothetical protein
MALSAALFFDSLQCTEVHFASFLSGGFNTATVVNPPERKLAKRTSVQWFKNATYYDNMKQNWECILVCVPIFLDF